MDGGQPRHRGSDVSYQGRDQLVQSNFAATDRREGWCHQEPGYGHARHEAHEMDRHSGTRLVSGRFGRWPVWRQRRQPCLAQSGSAATATRAVADRWRRQVFQRLSDSRSGGRRRQWSRYQFRSQRPPLLLFKQSSAGSGSWCRHRSAAALVAIACPSQLLSRPDRAPTRRAPVGECH